MCAGSPVYGCLKEGAQYCSLAPRPGSPSVPSNPVRATPRAASPGCAPGDRMMSWSRWRMRWSGGYVDRQLGGGAEPGRVLRPKGAGGPGTAPSLACAFSQTQPGTSCLQCLPGGPLGWSTLRLLTAPISVVSSVWPLWRPRHACDRRAGQGRAGKCPLYWLKLLFLAP